GWGPIGDDIAALGTPVEALGLAADATLPLRLGRLTRRLRAARPDVVQTWLYHADLLGGLASRMTSRAPVVWGLHSSNLEPGIMKARTIRVAQTCARLSGWLPTAVVCCSESTRELHAQRGYRRDRVVVIPNGIDLDAFRPDPAARGSVRAELGLAPDARLIGLAARFDPQKDHHTFVRAAAIVAAADDRARFVLFGDRVTPENAELSGWIERAGIGDRVRLLGRRRDVARLQASLDIATLSSAAVEALPLAIAEAMACGVPGVVTDVGDSARLVGDAGRVVPPRDAAALAGAWLDVLALPPAAGAALGARARDRIAAHYALPDTVRRYEALYERVGASKPCAV
ncbi:MAG: glycosyltransferase, partial [Thermomicrobiales bacterium]|nr:glycosyltransferase [Thermomicrobiales bacterium]